MAQVTVTISGKTYRMACGDGEEAHLERLAAIYDGKIDEMRGAFGEIGDMRLHVMAALTLADDLTDARDKLAAAQAEIAELSTVVAGSDERGEAHEQRVAETVARAAERIERLARSLNAPTQPTAAEE